MRGCAAAAHYSAAVVECDLQQEQEMQLFIRLPQGGLKLNAAGREFAREPPALL